MKSPTLVELKNHIITRLLVGNPGTFLTIREIAEKLDITTSGVNAWIKKNSTHMRQLKLAFSERENDSGTGRATYKTVGHPAVFYTGNLGNSSSQDDHNLPVLLMKRSTKKMTRWSPEEWQNYAQLVFEEMVADPKAGVNNGDLLNRANAKMPPDRQRRGLTGACQVQPAMMFLEPLLALWRDAWEEPAVVSEENSLLRSDLEKGHQYVTALESRVKELEGKLASNVPVEELFTVIAQMEEKIVRAMLTTPIPATAPTTDIVQMARPVEVVEALHPPVARPARVFIAGIKKGRLAEIMDKIPKGKIQIAGVWYAEDRTGHGNRSASDLPTPEATDVFFVNTRQSSHAWVDSIKSRLNTLHKGKLRWVTGTHPFEGIFGDIATDGIDAFMKKPNTYQV